MPAALARTTWNPRVIPSEALIVRSSPSLGCVARAELTTAQPAEFDGSQTTRSGMVVISTGTVTTAAGTDRDLGTRRDTASAAVAADILATRRPAYRPRCGSPSCIRPASSRLCQVAEASPGVGFRRPLDARPDRSGLDRRAGSPSLLGWPSRRRARPARAWLNWAGEDGCPFRIGDAVQHLQIAADGPTVGLKPTRPALPVHERARLLGPCRDREHHVGAVGHCAGAVKADYGGRFTRGQRGSRIGQVIRIDAGDDECVGHLGRFGRRRQDLAVSRPRYRLERGHAPGPWPHRRGQRKS